MTNIIVTTPDDADIAAALEEADASVTVIDHPITGPKLEDAGIDDTSLFILTDPAEATAIPLTRELNADIRIVVYGATGLPEFATHQADLVLSSDAIDQAVVVEELLDHDA